MKLQLSIGMAANPRSAPLFAGRVQPDGIERVPSHSHRGAVGFPPPQGVTIRQVPPEKNLGSMMLAGEIDATVHYIANANLVDRSRTDLWNHPEIRPLFADAVAEGVRCYKKT